jgi:hypothetical protein
MVAVHRIVAHRRAGGRRGRFSGSEVLALLAGIGLLLVMNNPLSQARFVFGAMALSFVVLLGGCRSTRATRRTMVCLLAALFFVFPIADAFRCVDQVHLEFSLVKEYPGNGDYDAFAQIHNSMTVVRERGYSFLSQPLGVALFWVPRTVWPGKPNDTGIYLAEARGYPFTNLSAPLWAEFYVSGGIALVAIGFLGLGRLLRTVDDRLVRAMRGHDEDFVVHAFMPFYLVILLRGSLLQATALVATFYLAALLTRPGSTKDAPAAR